MRLSIRTLRVRGDSRATRVFRSIVTGILPLLGLCAAFAAPAAADEPECAAIARAVATVPGSGPAFLASYPPAEGVAAEPALDGAAFTYDNALAAIALIACGRETEARRIGDALVAASAADRAGTAGRIRNAYRAGAIREYPPPPMGWWDRGRNAWAEDPYQVGSATGNLAWAGLALLTLADATRDPRYRDGAERIGRYTAGFADDLGAGGFIGGVQGFDAEARPLTWKSTEHNTDVAAFFARLGGDWAPLAAHARRFVEAMWRPRDGRFLIGTAPDGATPAESVSGLDSQLWPQLLADAPRAWRAAFDTALANHAAQGGLDFNDDRDGLWTEGTAQGALVAQRLGRADEARRLLGTARAQAGPGGYLLATRNPSITTGLAIGPESTTDDFRYYRRPHLGATAWAALAARRFNPFTGARLDARDESR